MKHVVEPATVTQTGTTVLIVELKACPDVSWGFYLDPPHPGGVKMSSQTRTCLEKLKIGDAVDVEIAVKPLNSSGGTHGGSATRVGKCVLRPKDGDDYDGYLSSGKGANCPWAREEKVGP